MSRAIAENPAVRRQTAVLAALAVGFYLLLCAVLFSQIRQRNGGHFTYALDDPYIHLALSEQIAHGHYGINPGEPSSPSSSVLWPFLLAPFAGYRWQIYVPLALNILAGVCAAVLAAAAVARWPSPSDAAHSGDEWWRRGLSVIGLVFIGNLLGLTFVGMEHTLQVLLAGAGAWGIIACLRGRPVPVWCLVAAACGPLVRYENLGISVGLAIALLGQRQARRATVLLVASIVPLLLFSAYLHSLGLPWLPTSVLVKGQMAQAGTGFEQRGVSLVKETFTQTLVERHRMIVGILFLTLAGVAWNERERGRRFALWGATAATGLHLFVGRFHWFHRYEVYIVFFSALVVLHVLHERPRSVLGWYALGLVGCSYLYLQAFHDVPFTANDVYREQYQMHRFATEFYSGNVAVNDLGLVSYRRRPGTYVLDLYGLASVESARQKNKSTAWLDGTVRAHHVGLVMYYPGWFAPPPPDWTLLGELCLPEPPVALGGTCVSYYATPQASLPLLRDEFDDFTETLPPGLIMKVPGFPPSPSKP